MGNFLPSVAHEAKKAIQVSGGTRTKLCSLKLKLKLKLWQLKGRQKTKHSSDTSARHGLKSKAEIPEERAICDGQKKGVVRVKVLLTKKEAAQLLAMCARGDQEKVIARVVGELERVGAHRRTSSCHGAWRPSLASIPED